MSKLTQLEQLQALGAPTAPFRGISYADFQAGTYQLDGLAFPVAVRSTFSEEDGATQSFAGHFTTKLQVEQNEVEDAISEVFASYPTPEQQEVIVQQMVQPDYSGVLFAYRGGVWQLEMVEGLGEQLVGGQQTPEQLLLPKFALMDAWMQQYMRVWDSSLPDRASEKAVMQLSYWAGRLNEELDAPHGLDIEFAITNNQLYLLQARPITTPAEKEEVLTSANHKEILPPYPSRLMTDVISESGTALFEYYQDLDPSLGDRAFIKMAAGMPWINLSALLDTMVHWGLPTQLVCDSVGAEDFYRVGLRPYRALRKFGVFWKVLQQQLGVRKSVKQWIATQNRGQQWEQRQREALWESAPAEAFKQWYAAFQKLYVGLVTNMQVLTGAMSGPVGTLNKLGLLTKVSDAAKIKSASTDYMQAYQDLSNGLLERATFVEQFGHRGFYESDLGQKRFAEYTEQEWRNLLPDFGDHYFEPKAVKTKQRAPFWVKLFTPVIHLIHAREHLRAESMRWFAAFRLELLEAFRQMPVHMVQPFDYTKADISALLEGRTSLHQLQTKTYAEQSGWDMDTFLANELGRRRSVPGTATRPANQGIGIYPGTLKGQVWRVESADFRNSVPPPFERIILVAEALDPGWIPYFSKVDGVISYVGGLLSHASIILRESQIPSITQLPRQIDLQTGDWIEIDGLSGKVKRIESPEEAIKS